MAASVKLDNVFCAVSASTFGLCMTRSVKHGDVYGIVAVCANAAQIRMRAPSGLMENNKIKANLFWAKRKARGGSGNGR